MLRLWLLIGVLGIGLASLTGCQTSPQKTAHPAICCQKQLCCQAKKDEAKAAGCPCQKAACGSPADRAETAACPKCTSCKTPPAQPEA